MLLINNNSYLFQIIPKYLNITLIPKYVKQYTIKIITIPKYILNLLYFLKKHTYTKFEILNDIVVYDLLTEIIRFKIIYVLRTFIWNNSIEVLIMLNKINNNYILPSVHKVYYSSLWIENEIWDLFGIYFLENKYLSRILTDYGFIGFPLRKDFPLTGYLELKYQLKNKLLFYTKVELTQEYRNFFNIYKK